MIAYLRGVVASRQPPELVIEAGGVGYRVHATMATFEGLPQDDEQTVVPTVLVVSENAHTLYGFANEEERQWFGELTRITGVGAKTALATLSTLPGAALRQCLEAGDVKGLTRVPGLGPKTAQRLLLELESRIPEVAEGDAAPAGTPQHDARQGLERLGWKPAEARRMVAAVDSQDMDAEEIIRAVLRGSLG